MKLNDACLHDIYHLLPASVRHLMTVISPAGALQLVDQFGGTLVLIPSSPTEDLANGLSQDDLTRLCSYYGGAPLWIPRCDKALRYLSAQQMLCDAENGLSRAQLARKYRMTDRGVIKALARVNAGKWGGAVQG